MKTLLLIIFLFSIMLCGTSLAAFWSNQTEEPADPATYLIDQLYNFSTTWETAQNTTSESLVSFEFNQTSPISPTLSNTTLINNSGLVAYWKFSEGSGFSTTGDSSGNSVVINATTQGMNTTGNSTSGWTTGYYGNGLLFDGVNDYVNTTGVGNLSNTGFSFTAWVYPKRVKFNTIFTRLQYSSYRGYLFRLENVTTYVRLMMQVCNATTRTEIESDTVKVELNQWSFVAGTWNNATGQTCLYVNGTISYCTNSVINYQSPNITAVHIMSTVVAVDVFNGTMDEVRIYNRTLSSAEVLALYNSGKHIYNKTVSNLTEGQYLWREFMTLTNGTEYSTDQFTYDVVTTTTTSTTTPVTTSSSTSTTTISPFTNLGNWYFNPFIDELDYYQICQINGITGNLNVSANCTLNIKWGLIMNFTGC